jgi:ABC-type sugar transport system permease subunit
MKNSNRRRRYWINPSFQSRYLRRILLLELIVVALTAVLSLGLALVLVNQSLDPGPTWQRIFIYFVLLAIAVGCGLIWLGIRVSHRICGPVYRIQLTLAAFEAGGAPRPHQLARWR